LWLVLLLFSGLPLHHAAKPLILFRILLKNKEKKKEKKTARSAIYPPPHKEKEKNKEKPPRSAIHHPPKKEKNKSCCVRSIKGSECDLSSKQRERNIGGERSILLLTKRRRKGAECDLRRVKRRRTRITDLKENTASLEVTIARGIVQRSVSRASIAIDRSSTLQQRLYPPHIPAVCSPFNVSLEIHLRNSFCHSRLLGSPGTAAIALPFLMTPLHLPVLLILLLR
jgi:hypothetical protein